MTAIPRAFSLLGTVALCAYITTSCGSRGQSPAVSHPQRTATTSAHETSEFASAMAQSMATMDAGMMAAPLTGNPDVDFCAMMIPHHQGAIDMAKALLVHGRDPVLRRLAGEIIVTQGQEIEVMRLRLAALGAAQPASTRPGRRDATTAPMPVAPSSDRVYTADQTSNTV